MILLLYRSAKPPSETPLLVGQALQDITLPEGSGPSAFAKANNKLEAPSDKPKIMYNLDKEESITTLPVKPPQAKEKERKSRSSSKSSRSSHSSRSSSGSRSPPRKRSPASNESDAEKKKEKKVVEVCGNGILYMFHCLTLYKLIAIWKVSNLQNV